MKIVTPFDSIGYWAQGPWMFFNMGLRFVQTWQEECYSRLRLVPLGRLPMLPIVPFARPAAQHKESSTELPQQQGRQAPALGCLQNVVVVGGPVDPVGRDAPLGKPVKAIKQVKPVNIRAAVVPKPSVQSADRSRDTGSVAADQSAGSEPVPGVAVSSSVTSMLAMQAKSLAKAVNTGGRAPVAAVKPNRPAAKPVAKSASKSGASVAVASAAARSAAQPQPGSANRKAAAKAGSAPAPKGSPKASVKPRPVPSKKA